MLHLRAPESRIGDYPVPSKSIKSGKYVVGTEPAIELGIDRSLYIYMWNAVETCLFNVTIYQAVNKILSYPLLMSEQEFIAT